MAAEERGREGERKERGQVDRKKVERIRKYHFESKHHYPDKFAPGPGFLDWDSQPNPYRSYGSPSLPLRLFSKEENGDTCTYDEMYQTDEKRCVPPSFFSISKLLYYSFSLSSWKKAGKASWKLRVNPSSGNLHPTECYLIIPWNYLRKEQSKEVIEEFETNLTKNGDPCENACIFHYSSLKHSLQLRGSFSMKIWGDLVGKDVPPDSFLVGLTSVYWRESWKYGMRAFRYCNHDIGHAMGTLRFSCSLLGWKPHLISQLSDENISKLLGISRKEEFSHPSETDIPDGLFLVSPSPTPLPETNLLFNSPLFNEICEKGCWYGKPERLSPSYREWKQINDAHAATFHEIPESGSSDKPSILFKNSASQCAPLASARHGKTPAGVIIRQRRSAVDFDSSKSIFSRGSFFSMLSKLLPELCPLPWDIASHWDVEIHLVLFVHQVAGLPPGMYVLSRTSEEKTIEFLKQQISHQSFQWKKPAGCPPSLPLFCIKEKDVTRYAKHLSCHQDIASDGAFSLGMVAQFDSSLKKHGASHYRKLFWEAGLIGQVLYLEAEAEGLRGTGIGCFFDNAVHEIFGIEGTELQSLYHFTVGFPVEDTRVQTTDPYHEGR